MNAIVKTSFEAERRETEIGDIFRCAAEMVG